MPEIPSKISDEALAAVDENCVNWVRKVTGNPEASVSPLSQERVHEIAQLVWGLAYRAGREDAAEAVWAKACELRKNFRTGDFGIEYVNGMEDATEIARGGQQ